MSDVEERGSHRQDRNKPAAKTEPAGKTAPAGKITIGITPMTLWMIIGVVIAVVAVIVIVVQGTSAKSSSKSSGAAASTGSQSVAPVAVDTSGSYATLVTRANGLYDQGTALMTDGVPSQQGSQFFAAAAQVYAAAWGKQTGDASMGTDYAVALFYSGDIEAALKQIGVVLAGNPGFQPGLYNKGIFLFHKSQMAAGDAKLKLEAQAKRALRAAIAIDPNNTVGKNAAAMLGSIK